MPAPVLFLVFNRPDHTKLSLARIRKAKPPRLYVHSDGARSHVGGEADKVEQVRAIIRTEIDWDCDIKTIYRTENRGLRQGVLDALNWFFGAEPYGIVLEDDCVPDLSFFRFCEETLLLYQHDPQVMHIGCSNLAEALTQNQPESFVFSRFSFVWGWASWRRAWQMMSADLEGLDEYARSGAIRSLITNPMAQTYMLDKFYATQRRENQSWAYAWFYSILKNNGLCIVPKLNLVQNTGVGDESATNTTTRNDKASLRAQSLAFPLKIPGEREPDPRLERQFFYLTQKRRFRLWLWYILRIFGLR